MKCINWFFADLACFIRGRFEFANDITPAGRTWHCTTSSIPDQSQQFAFQLDPAVHYLVLNLLKSASRLPYPCYIITMNERTAETTVPQKNRDNRRCSPHEHHRGFQHSNR
ncbi:hypothetical protein TNCT_568121 [Trichonephila clavata]|uniref:Uncharacterized protein n=1 Tax=Trichonephila clavata TaxID=2740835 RepID=A0A8X6LM37_TRICU|nr:hypothetical protein TNCT_568121 [Trichonephila clavata]